MNAGRVRCIPRTRPRHPQAPSPAGRFAGGEETVRQLSDLMEIFRLLASGAFGIWMCRIPSLN